MKRLAAVLVLCVAVVGAAVGTPALGEVAQKTELVDLDGANVERMPLRHEIDATWVVDNQTVLYRDTSRGHYLVTLKAACNRIVQREPFAFRPSDPWALRADTAYEIRPAAGRACDVARIEQIETERADALREAAVRRVW